MNFVCCKISEISQTVTNNFLKVSLSPPPRWPRASFPTVRGYRHFTFLVLHDIPNMLRPVRAL